MKVSLKFEADVVDRGKAMNVLEGYYRDAFPLDNLVSFNRTSFSDLIISILTGNCGEDVIDCNGDHFTLESHFDEVPAVCDSYFSLFNDLEGCLKNMSLKINVKSM